MDLIASFPPSGKFIQNQLKISYNKKFHTWKNGIPENHIQKFVEHGLIPFLKKNGYLVGISNKVLTKYLESWAFCHVYLYENAHQELEIQYLKWFHDGGNEEYDWYCNLIPESDWVELAEQWQVYTFLDDSDVGNLQRCDLSWCIWHCISLDGSKSHEKWVQMILDSEEQEEEFHAIQTNDQQAYGGDRRTYS